MCRSTAQIPVEYMNRRRILTNISEVFLSECFIFELVSSYYAYNHTYVTYVILIIYQTSIYLKINFLRILHPKAVFLCS